MNTRLAMTRRHPNAPSIVRGGVSKALLSLTVVSLAYSAPPPPPTEYTLTVNRSGGGECTTFHINTPVGSWNTPTSEEFEVTFVAGTFIEVEAEVDCPCAYQADHWLVNDEEIDEGGSRTLAGFDLYEDTTATAVFEPRLAKLHIYVIDPTPDAYPHNLDQIGHTFWMFEGSCVPEEYEDIVGKAWGFYPAAGAAAYTTDFFGYKTWVLCAGELKDDTHYVRGLDYNEYESVTIDYDELIAGLAYTKSLLDDPPQFHVESFNCTDAAIAAAAEAGYAMPNAHGTCNESFCDLTHSFSGNCPGTLGDNL